MYLALAAVFTLVVLFFTFRIRTRDLPEPEVVSPFHHLDVRKAAIYENLRDLQFEYRLGKLSDQDYQRTKLELQSQLAGVLAEIDKIKGSATAPASKPKPASKKQELSKHCPHCGATFDKPLKFCGECGKAMAGDAA
jgi:hypothetical protein